MSGIIELKNRPTILSSATVVGCREHSGPFGDKFDLFDESDSFGKSTWEQSEAEMQRLALQNALDKINFSDSDIDALFAGDLMNQCISSGYGLENYEIPFFGIFGACSTVAEGLVLSSMLVDSSKLSSAAVVTSSHNCSAERQFRFPLEYGGQRTPSSQWTVTGAGAYIISKHCDGFPFISAVLPGIVRDFGISDVSNMGAAMAPVSVILRPYPMRN